LAPPHIAIYPAGHQDAANLYYRYLLPLGRGYAQLIDEITTAAVDNRGFAVVGGRGHLFSPQRGTWHLEIDLNSDCLVRQASFTLDGATSRTFVSTGEGLLKSDISLLQRGRFDLAGYPVSVAVMAYSRKCDREILSTALSRVNNVAELPNLTTIMDFHAVDGDGIPLVARVHRLPR
jgi:hypothetical protein